MSSHIFVFENNTLKIENIYIINMLYIFFTMQFMANTPMQGAYIPQYAHMQTATVPVEVSAISPVQPNFNLKQHERLDLGISYSLFQENGALSQVDTSGNHSPYSYQQTK